MQKRFYLDWNATSPLWPEVKEAMLRAFDSVGNASSIHQEGQQARAIVERARRALGEAIDAPAQAIVLTGGATEANNQVLRTHALYTKRPFIVCSAVEHPSVLEVVEELDETFRKVRAAILGVDHQGRLDLVELERLLGEGATLVSVMYANNEIGNVYPIKEIADMCRAHDALCHVDATQAFGRLPLSFRELGVDIMTLSVHKMGGPKGVGALIVREGLVQESMMAGGHQERGRRPGTENVPAIAGLAAVSRLVRERRQAWQESMEARRAHLLARLMELLPEGSVELRGDQAARLPNTLNLAFEGVTGEDALLSLDLGGVSASSGSACTAGSIEPSHVVLAMGFGSSEAKRSVRLSVGPGEGVEDLDEAAEVIAQTIGRLMKRTYAASV